MFCRKFSHTLMTKTTVTYGIVFRNYVNIRQKIDNDLLMSTFDKTKINSIDDWKTVRKMVLEHEFNRGQFTKANIDASIVSYCTISKRFDLASSYLNFLNRENIRPNLATLGRYLKLLYLKNEDYCLKNAKTCPKDEEKLIIDLYENLRKEYPILDSITLENCIAALSVTTQWRKCLDLLKDIKISAAPNTLSYSALVSAAFLNDNEELAWNLLDEMLENNRVPKDTTFLSYVRCIMKLRKKEKALEKLEKLFLFFQENALICPHKVALGIDDASTKLRFRNDFTSVTYKGLCKSCNKKLDSFELNDEEFKELKQRVLDKVIIGKDVFVKTNPQELERFREFIATMGKFDVILDGLNVAYSAGTKQTPAVLSALLASVVSHFVQQEKKVLVLGRVHMSRWPRDNWGYVKENATLFLTQNISQDDPYLLYCALNSGKDTVIVTRDLMRGHKFLLRSSRHKILFNRWLSQRQYQLLRVDSRRGPIFRIPLRFSILAQKNGNTWHVPYETEGAQDQNEYNRMWLCLKTQYLSTK